MVLENAMVNSWTSLTYNGNEYAVENKFRLASFVTGVPTRTYVIVSYDHDVVTLYIIKQETATALDESTAESSQSRLVVRDGIVVVETGDGMYSLQGEKIF
jgi:hypothetical protein